MEMERRQPVKQGWDPRAVNTMHFMPIIAAKHGATPIGSVWEGLYCKSCGTWGWWARATPTSAVSWFALDAFVPAKTPGQRLFVRCVDPHHELQEGVVYEVLEHIVTTTDVCYELRAKTYNSCFCANRFVFDHFEDEPVARPPDIVHQPGGVLAQHIARAAKAFNAVVAPPSPPPPKKYQPMTCTCVICGDKTDGVLAAFVMPLDPRSVETTRCDGLLCVNEESMALYCERCAKKVRAYVDSLRAATPRTRYPEVCEEDLL